jgi:hypothetical protein
MSMRRPIIIIIFGSKEKIDDASDRMEDDRYTVIVYRQYLIVYHKKVPDPI